MDFFLSLFWEAADTSNSLVIYNSLIKPSICCIRLVDAVALSGWWSAGCLEICLQTSQHSLWMHLKLSGVLVNAGALH